PDPNWSPDGEATRRGRKTPCRNVQLVIIGRDIVEVKRAVCVTVYRPLITGNRIDDCHCRVGDDRAVWIYNHTCYGARAERLGFELVVNEQIVSAAIRTNAIAEIFR